MLPVVQFADWPIDRVRVVSGDATARYVEVEAVVAVYEAYPGRERTPLDVGHAISFTGLWLIRDVSDDDDWYMGTGDATPADPVVCWATYGGLAEAIQGL